MTSSISSSVDADGICTITWDLPDSPINKINEQNIGEFEAALKKAVEDKGVKGIIIASAKDEFIVGADLAMLKGMRERPVDEVFADVMKFHQLLRYMETCGKPVVTALTGSAFGGGLEIALASHHRIVSDQPKLKLGFPEV